MTKKHTKSGIENATASVAGIIHVMTDESQINQAIHEDYGTPPPAAILCPRCNSTQISGLYGSFWAPLDENGEDPLHLGEHEGSTELTGRCTCRACDYEFDEDDEPMYWLLQELQFDQLPSGEPSILYPTGRYGSDYEHLNAQTLRFLADELERRASAVERCRWVQEGKYWRAPHGGPFPLVQDGAHRHQRGSLCGWCNRPIEYFFTGVTEPATED